MKFVSVRMREYQSVKSRLVQLPGRDERHILRWRNIPDRVRISQDMQRKETAMAWTTPEISEVCVGMEVTSYASAEI